MPRISPLGVAWKFPIQPNDLGRIATTDDLGNGNTSEQGDIDHIFQTITQIVGTNKYERIFNPFFFGGVHDFLFEPLQVNLDGVAESVFFDNVIRLEKRITVLGTFTLRDQITGTLKLGLKFFINKSNVQGDVIVG